MESEEKTTEETRLKIIKNLSSALEVTTQLEQDFINQRKNKYKTDSDTDNVTSQVKQEPEPSML
jgi:hypothetical protein